MKSLEPTIRRLEAAGGALSEAVDRARKAGLDDELIARLSRLSVGVGDLRAAIVKRDHARYGDQPLADVLGPLDAQLRTLFPDPDPDRTRPVGEARMYPGDPRYDGFTITELWMATAVDPADSQEGLLVGPMGPLMASDKARLDDYVLPVARRKLGLVDGPIVIKHLAVTSAEEVTP